MTVCPTESIRWRAGQSRYVYREEIMIITTSPAKALHWGTSGLVDSVRDSQAKDLGVMCVWY